MSTTKKTFLISTICLYAFAVFGQWIIVMTVHQGGYAKQAEMRLITLLGEKGESAASGVLFLA